jgi:hypothetical protein
VFAHSLEKRDQRLVSSHRGRTRAHHILRDFGWVAAELIVGEQPEHDSGIGHDDNRGRSAPSRNDPEGLFGTAGPWVAVGRVERPAFSAPLANGW